MKFLLDDGDLPELCDPSISLVFITDTLWQGLISGIVWFVELESVLSCSGRL